MKAELIELSTLEIDNLADDTFDANVEAVDCRTYGAFRRGFGASSAHGGRRGAEGSER